MTGLRPETQSLSIRELIFGEDPRQGHRLTRYFMAVGSSLLALGLMYALYLSGDLEFAGLALAAVQMVLLFALFYALIRSGLNQRFADPSLTVWQMMASLIVILQAMYHSSSEMRPLFYLVFLMTFLFGIFRLDTVRMLTMCLFAAAGYGMVIVLLIQRRPEALDVQLEVMRWGTVTAMLAWFSVMGGYISRMRKELSQSRRDLENALQTIRGMTVQDELTGIPNRRFLRNALRQLQALSVRSGEPFCLGVADIDFFKNINDTLGHAAGDAVLRYFAESASRALRVSDQFGRYGGEEFMLLMPQTTLPEAMKGAERLRQHCESLRYPVDDNLCVTLSIGIAQYRIGEDVEETLKRADRALYQAKGEGRNRVACVDDMADVGIPRVDGAAGSANSAGL